MRHSVSSYVHRWNRQYTRAHRHRPGAVLPACVAGGPASVEHRCSRNLNNALERDHGHLKQRLWPMRGFKDPASADVVVRGHALVQNLRNGFSTLTAPVEHRLRLLTAWSQLERSI